MGALSIWHILVLLVALAVVVAIVAGVVVLIAKASGPKTPSAPMGQVRAGWYPDIHDPSLVRYYDGLNWTGHTQPAGNQFTEKRN